MASVFETLNAINVNGHTEKKNGLTYLSWAWAWAECKKAFPSAEYKIYENADGWNYFTDGNTCWVKTGVIIEGIEHIEYLPVMDFRNKSIKLDQVTSFDVNKAIQRSLTKALARHGLGLYIYAGEDLPEGEAENEVKNNSKKNQKKEVDSPEENFQPNIEVLKAVLDEHGIDLAVVFNLYKMKSFDDLTQAKYVNIMKNIDKIKEKQEKGNE